MQKSLFGARLTGLAMLTVLGCAAVVSAQTFRSINGIGNNSGQSLWGAADTPLLRQTLAAYPGDGSGSTIVESPARANPRDISNVVINQGAVNLFNDRQMSDFVWQWGQFLDHDIDLTDSSASNGLANIPILGVGDPLGPNPIPFTRSNYAAGTGTAGNPRQQTNSITAYIDASNVYGSDSTRAAALRTVGSGGPGTGAKLQTSAGNLLPFNTAGLPNANALGAPDSSLFLAGDVRANEQVGLTAMHTLFLREHNRLADALMAKKPAASEEVIYQTTRKIVGAEMQVITYHEFLPIILGNNAPKAEDYIYSASVDASIKNEFSTAFYRFGHTMLSPQLQLVNGDGSSAGSIALRDSFFNSSFLSSDPQNVDRLLNGLCTQLAQNIDAKLVDDVRNFLFGPPGAGGMDLASLNIQRGRDHGLPDYNTLRQAYGLSPVSSFSEITQDVALQAALASVYGDVNNIDPWVGGLAEDHLAGAAVGPLVSAALVDQFTRSRDGDSFFYYGDADLNDPDIVAVFAEDGLSLGSLTLYDVLHLNTTSMASMPLNVFAVPEPSTLSLAMLGLCGGLWCLVRRRKIRGA